MKNHLAAYGFALSLLYLLPSHAPAAEITSNGKGGGDWSNPATWLGQKVPGADDDAVIQKGDIVDFDRDDDGKVSCRKLLIDPRGAFRLKTGKGKITCCLAGPVESRGLIQVDGTKSANDTLELRLVGSERSLRHIQLLKGAGLVVRGRDGLPEGRRNVALTSPKVADQKEDFEAVIADGRIKNGILQGTTGGVVFDLQKAHLMNVLLMAWELDNTGSRANEQLNIVDNRFTGRSRLWLQKCDSPLIRKNTLDYPGTRWAENTSAILISECPLAEVRDNTVRGYHYAVHVPHPLDATIAGNTFEKCGVGVHLAYGRSCSLYKNGIRDCDRGFELHYAQNTTLENNQVAGAKIAVRSLNATSQIASLEVSNPAQDGIGLLYDADQRCEGNVVLINCNIRADQVKLARQPMLPANAPLPVEMLQCLVVAAKDAPAGASIEVRTVRPMPALPAGAADPNVRNSPATLEKGLTPLPGSAGTSRDVLPLIVNSWSIDATGKTLPPPEYEVRLLGPDGKMLKSVKVKPADSWFRARPDDPTPTVEVK
jgi:parallel beta-helix repeat protein